MSLSIAEAISEGAAKLTAAGVPDARREAATLLAHASDRDRTYVITRNDELLTEQQIESFRAFIIRRAAREPLQYIIGHQEFFRLDFEVTPDVLIPRPETELIVEVALDLLKDVSAPTIADIGTGSGASRFRYCMNCRTRVQSPPTSRQRRCAWRKEMLSGMASPIV